MVLKEYCNTSRSVRSLARRRNIQHVIPIFIWADTFIVDDTRSRSLSSCVRCRKASVYMPVASQHTSGCPEVHKSILYRARALSVTIGRGTRLACSTAATNAAVKYIRCRDLLRAFQASIMAVCSSEDSISDTSELVIVDRSLTLSDSIGFRVFEV